MLVPFNREILSNSKIIEGNKFEDRYMDRASEEMFNSLYIEDVIESIRDSKLLYVIPAKSSDKYGRDLYNFIVEYRGYKYGLGATLNRDGSISVNTFLNEGMINYSLSNPSLFPQIEL